MKSSFMSRAVVWAGIVGLVTGITNAMIFFDQDRYVAALLRHFLNNTEMVVQLLPGAVFGIGALVYFNRILDLHNSLYKKSIWVIGNSLSFYAAFLGGMLVANWIWSLLKGTFLGSVLDWSTLLDLFICGGLIGASIVAIAFTLAFQKLNVRATATIAGIGALVAGIVYVILWMFDINPIDGGIDATTAGSLPFWVALFTVWQTTMLLLLGHYSKKQVEN